MVVASEKIHAKCLWKSHDRKLQHSGSVRTSFPSPHPLSQVLWTNSLVTIVVVRGGKLELMLSTTLFAEALGIWVSSTVQLSQSPNPPIPSTLKPTCVVGRQRKLGEPQATVFSADKKTWNFRKTMITAQADRQPTLWGRCRKQERPTQRLGRAAPESHNATPTKQRWRGPQRVATQPGGNAARCNAAGAHAAGASA